MCTAFRLCLGPDAGSASRLLRGVLLQLDDIRLIRGASR